jgi:peptidoglycan/LPS O-acetylase OafA/YrhL
MSRSVAFPFVERAGGGRDQVLDGFRAVAVLSVMTGHTLLFKVGVSGALSNVAGSAAVTGVEIFFLISGYVITLLLLLERERSAVDLRAFYVRRVLRIIPAFYVYLAAVAVLSLVGYVATPRADLAASASFLCNTGLPCSWFVGHSWSLAVEEQFYLVWPSVFLLLAFRRLVPVLLAIAGGLLALSLARGFVPFANNMSFLYIAIGALVACSSRLQSWVLARIGPAQWLALAIALLAGILFLPDRLMLAGKPMLLAGLVFGAGNASLVREVLTRRWVQMVGKMSYSLYLWQELFLARADSYHGAAPLVLVLLLPVVAWLSWRFIEVPGMAAGRAYTRRSDRTYGSGALQGEVT